MVTDAPDDSSSVCAKIPFSRTEPCRAVLEVYHGAAVGRGVLPSTPGRRCLPHRVYSCV